MDFAQWFYLLETQLINEDFKTQKQKFLSLGMDATIIDRYFAWFKDKIGRAHVNSSH